MQVRDLYHGTNGDNILEIIRLGALKPNSDGKLFFSERRFDSVLMHGADLRRKVTLAIKLRVTIAPPAVVQQAATAGVPDTLVVSTSIPLRAQVLELYVREPRDSNVKIIKGTRN